MRGLAFVVVGASLVAGCTGKVVMSPLSPKTLKEKYHNRKDIDGVIVYRPIQVIEVDKLVQIDVSSGKGANSSSVLSGDCSPTKIQRVVTIPDYDHPYAIRYSHGVLESYKFGITLNPDGVLTSVNDQSTPDQGKTLDNIVTAATGALGAVGKVAPVGGRVGAKEREKPKCTVTRTFQYYETMPLVRPYSR